MFDGLIGSKQYIQAKGRARNPASHFHVFVSPLENPYATFSSELEGCRNVQVYGSCVGVWPVSILTKSSSFPRVLWFTMNPAMFNADDGAQTYS